MESTINGVTVLCPSTHWSTYQYFMQWFGEACEHSLYKAMREGNTDFGAIMIGQNVPLLTEIRTAQEIIVDVVRGAEKVLGREIF